MIASMDTVSHPLDNICWHTLSGPHAAYAEASGPVLRYDPDVSVFAAADRIDDATWTALASTAGRGGDVVLFRDVVPDPPVGWSVGYRGRGIQMVLSGPLCEASEPPGIRDLTTDDAPAMMDLVAATTPGPFRPRTVELGGYVGLFDGDRLVAMAGERLSAAGFGEISAVCTRRETRGRGVATALTRRVARAVADRGDVPYLQVAESNAAARRIYERLGFERRREVDYVTLTAPD